jgi:hypothetical protein
VPKSIWIRLHRHVRKARAGVAAYSECTEAQMMAMFGWRDHKMPPLSIAKASRDRLAIGGMEKIKTYDQMENIAGLAMSINQTELSTVTDGKNPEISTPSGGWRARRAIPFAAISMTYPSAANCNVPIKATGTFQFDTIESQTRRPRQ